MQSGESGAVQHFGAVERAVGLGPHFKFPDGVESVRLVPTERVLKEEFDFATAAFKRALDLRAVASQFATARKEIEEKAAA